MQKFLTTLLIVTALSACVSAEEERAAELRSDRETCIAYGFTPATPDFAECMIRVDERRAVQDMIYRQNAARIGQQLLNGPPVF